MEKEELYSKINEGLGSTQLSSKTISAFVDDVFEDVRDAESVSDDFIARKVNYLRSVNGQLHADVAAQVNDYKSKNPYTKPKEEPKAVTSEGEPEWFRSYKAEQEERIKAMEEARKAELEEYEKKELISSVKSGLKSKFKEAGIEVNNYFISQAMNEVQVPSLKDENGGKVEVSVDELVKKAESAYYRHLKEAGIGNITPRRGGGNGSKGAENWLDQKFKQKAAKEGWEKK